MSPKVNMFLFVRAASASPVAYLPTPKLLLFPWTPRLLGHCVSSALYGCLAPPATFGSPSLLIHTLPSNRVTVYSELLNFSQEWILWNFCFLLLLGHLSRSLLNLLADLYLSVAWRIYLSYWSAFLAPVKLLARRWTKRNEKVVKSVYIFKRISSHFSK